MTAYSTPCIDATLRDGKSCDWRVIPSLSYASHALPSQSLLNFRKHISIIAARSRVWRTQELTVTVPDKACLKPVPPSCS